MWIFGACGFSSCVCGRKLQGGRETVFCRKPSSDSSGCDDAKDGWLAGVPGDPDEDESRLRGLGLGADDYITKPFLPEELILRVTAVLKRVYRVKFVQEEMIALGKCQVDMGSGLVHWNPVAHEDRDEAVRNGELTLTAKEYAILQKLAQERGRIVTIDALCDAVWREENYGYENTLVVHIRRLREKIEEDPSHPKYLLTVRGLGYRLV